METTVTVNVSGRRFEISRDTLSKFPNTTLGQVTSNHESTATINRLSSIFKCVLSYYETGHLHIPSNVCPRAAQDELEFWGLSTDDLDICCRRKLMKFSREQTYLKKFEDSVTEKRESSCCSPGYSQTAIAKIQHKIWLLLDRPSSSVLATIYFMISSLIIILSVVVMFLKSIGELNEEMSPENWEQFYGDEYDAYKSKVLFLTDEDPEELREAAKLQNTSVEDLLGNFTLPKHVNKDPPILHDISLFCTVFFAAEIFLKLVCCPHVVQMFRSLLHIVDVLAVVASIVHVVVDILIPAEKYTTSYVDVVGALLVLRVLRLFRLAKRATGARVLAYTISNSYKELGFMVLLITINTVVFGTLAYNVDRKSMKSLPLASWWALITMTTVGYGDVVPQTDLGRLVGVVCACMGIGLLALTMPLFVENFLSLYSYASVFCEEKTAPVNSDKVGPLKDVTAVKSKL